MPDLSYETTPIGGGGFWGALWARDKVGGQSTGLKFGETLGEWEKVGSEKLGPSEAELGCAEGVSEVWC